MKKILLFLLVFACSHAFAEDSVPAKVGNAVEKGGKAAGHGIEVGAEAAGHGIQKGGEATVRGLKTAGKWVEKKLHAGGSDNNSEKDSVSK